MLAFDWSTFHFFLQSWWSICHMPGSGRDAGNSRSYRTPNPGPQASTASWGQGTELQALMESAKSHDTEGVECYTSPQEGPHNLRKVGKGACSGSISGGIRAEYPLGWLRLTTKGEKRHSREREQHEHRLGV